MRGNIKKDNQNYNFFNPFGNEFLNLKLEDKVTNNLLDFVNEFRFNSSKKNAIKNRDIVRGTYGTEIQNNSISNGEIFPLPIENNIVTNTISSIIELYGKCCSDNDDDDSILDAKIIDIWYVIMKEGDFHALHTHVTKDILLSGSIYLKIPELKYPQGSIVWSNGVDQSRLGSREFTHSPKAGETFVWPSTIPHSVYPFNGKGERIMISFNGTLLER